MSKQTQKSRYPSLYAPGKFVTFAKYLAELMCSRKGKSEGVDLPARFWNSSKEWRQYFLSQLDTANELVKKYSENAILTAVKEMNKVYSLRFPTLEDRIKELNAQVKIHEQTDIKPATESSTGRFVRKNRLGKLDE